MTTERKNLDDAQVRGSVTYVSKAGKPGTYYVVGDSNKFGSPRLHLTTLDGSFEFWVDEAKVTWKKRYESRNGRYQTLKNLRDYVTAQRGTSSNTQSARAVCAECGRPGTLIPDLEDGQMKHRNCCDIPR